MNEHGDEVSDLLDFEGAELFVPDDVPDHLQEAHHHITNKHWGSLRENWSAAAPLS